MSDLLTSNLRSAIDALRIRTGLGDYDGDWMTAAEAAAALSALEGSAVETASPLTSCPYCNRPAAEDGSIIHLGGCIGLETVDLNRLQYDALVKRVPAPKAPTLPDLIGNALQDKVHEDTGAVRTAQSVKATALPGPDLSCEGFVPDPHSRFCDRCGYPEREHRRAQNGEGSQ